MRQQQSKYLLLAALLYAFGSAAAQDILTPEQLIDRYEFGELQWSADGQRLALVVTEPVSENGQAANIWMYEAEADQIRQITWNGDSNHQPRWSPEGNSLAFLASRDEDKTQVYVMPMTGGEAQPLTKAAADVVGFEWSPDGKTIAFVSADPDPEQTEQEGKSKDDEIVVRETIKPVRLRVIDIATGDTHSLTDEKWRVSAFAWRPDGTALLVSATDDFSVELLTDRLFSISRDGQEMTELARPDGPVSKLSVSPDNRFLAYIGSTEGGPVPHGLYLQPLEGGDARDLTGKALDRMIEDFKWADDGGIWALMVDGLSDELVHLSIDGTMQQRKSFPERSITGFDVVGSVTAFIDASAVDPEELWISKASGDQRISNLNGDFPELVAPELIHFPAEGGAEIEAMLFTPTQTPKPRQGWSTVLLIHGGPSGRWRNRINDWAQLLVARGYAVLAPNIRGSIGYGLDFIRSNRYDWGGADYRDAIAGIDYLIESGITNPEQLAIAGWSYGGYMSAWAITQTDRFKAAVVGAGMTDLAVEYGTETAEINAYDTWYLGTPYENQADFIRMSPMTYVKNARTPALILIGEEDVIDPIAQSRQFYRGLKRYGVETELVIYPREPHRIKERSHRIDLLSRMIDWITTYLP
jgi:dipeptidyl aminopeptidase/acylaminoacyl peptidase